MAYVSQEKKKKLAPGIRAVLKKYGMKGTLSVRHRRVLVVKVISGEIDFPEKRIQVNEYHIDRHYAGRQRQFLNELLDAMKGSDYFDRSDSMVDYFHLSHYIAIQIGGDNKPYVYTGR